MSPVARIAVESDPITYNPVNWGIWVEGLARTEKPQTRRRLAQKLPDGRVGYCCLGFGAELVPNMHRREVEVTEPDNDHTGNYFLFGEVENEGLAPREFIDWLGLAIDDDDECSSSTEFDIFFDIPPNLITWVDKARLRRACSAASMNDAGFTFAQIADVARYFGPYGVSDG